MSSQWLLVTGSVKACLYLGKDCCWETLLQLLRSPDLSWVVSVPGREAVTPSLKCLHEQSMKAAGVCSTWMECWRLLDAAGRHRCPRDEFAAEHPLLQVKARGCAEPNPREGKGSCYFFLVSNHRFIESFRLERTFKIIESNRKPNTAKSTTKPCP